MLTLQHLPIIAFAAATLAARVAGFEVTHPSLDSNGNSFTFEQTWEKQPSVLAFFENFAGCNAWLDRGT